MSLLTLIWRDLFTYSLSQLFYLEVMWIRMQPCNKKQVQKKSDPRGGSLWLLLCVAPFLTLVAERKLNCCINPIYTHKRIVIILSLEQKHMNRGKVTGCPHQKKCLYYFWASLILSLSNVVAGPDLEVLTMIGRWPQ